MSIIWIYENVNIQQKIFSLLGYCPKSQEHVSDFLPNFYDQSFKITVVSVCGREFQLDNLILICFNIGFVCTHIQQGMFLGLAWKVWHNLISILFDLSHYFSLYN